MKMTTPISVIDRAIAQAIQEAKRKVVRMLAFLGEKCIMKHGIGRKKKAGTTKPEIFAAQSAM